MGRSLSLGAQDTLDSRSYTCGFLRGSHMLVQLAVETYLYVP
jgi:hypothetical protein